jgi:sterol desaturase/sphingolipid hydroxylase (fatty acid hydroxylase superfamily)
LARSERAGGVLGLAALGLLLWGEYRRPLRRQTEPKRQRNLRNVAIATLSAATIALVQNPLVTPLARHVERRRWGIRYLGLPRWMEISLSVILMDYTLYLWHVLSHRCKFLWRFHLVHHADLDMDASTALRFHFGEMVLSAPYRAAQVAAIGVSPKALAIWQNFLLLCIVFHHSNLRLPRWLEAPFARVIVTPRVHTIHHSTIKTETDSNWSSGLTIWDMLHGTFRYDVPEDDVSIGVPAYRDTKELTFGGLFTMPFRCQRFSWRLPDGTLSVRRPPNPRGYPHREVTFP